MNKQWADVLTKAKKKDMAEAVSAPAGETAAPRRMTTLRSAARRATSPAPARTPGAALALARASPTSTARRRSVLLIAAIMLVPLVDRPVLRVPRPRRCSIPLSGDYIGFDHFREIWADANFWNALRNTVVWTVASVRAAVRARPRPRAAAQPALPGARRDPGAGVPALGGAELPVRPELGLAVQSGGRARCPTGSRRSA